MEPIFKCKTCNWTGIEAELEFEQVESCAGDDKLEVCPKCGSMEVVQVFVSENNLI